MTCRCQGQVREARTRSDFVAAEDAARSIEQALPLLDSAVGVEWYQHHGTTSTARRATSAAFAGQGPASEAGRSTGTRRSARRSTWRARRRSSGSRAVRSPTWTRPAFRRPWSHGSGTKREPERSVANDRGRQSRRPKRKEVQRRRGTARARAGRAFSPWTTRRPAPEELARLARTRRRAGPPSSTAPCVDAASRSSAARADGSGDVLRLGHAAREDALVLVPELDEDDLDRRCPPEEAAEACVRDGLALAVRQDDREPLLRPRREVAQTRSVASAFKRRRSGREARAGGGCSMPIERSSVAVEDVLVDAREEVRQHPVRERGHTDGHVGQRRTQRARGILRTLQPLRRAELAPARASSATRRARRTPRHRFAPAGRASTRGRAAPLRARAAPRRRRVRRRVATSARRPGSSTPRRSRTLAALRDARQRGATSGTRTPTASSAPSGVRIVNDSASPQ